MLERLPAATEEQLKKFTPGIFKPSDKNFQIIASCNLSPSGKYSLLITNPIGEGWKICRGIIVDNKDNIIVDIIRTYGNFPFAWFGEDSHECILVSEEYYGTWVYCPKLGPRPLVSGSRYGEAFCPGGFIISPDHKYMVMYGCNWAAPWEYLVFNLESVFNGYLSCISVGKNMICGDEKPQENITWLSDKVVINAYMDMSETDVPDIKRYRYTIPFLNRLTVEEL